ncbi:hypothetical protein S40288_04090 [Stachybotrys chartarum IBT 40288]|nr:hypothetical protein S40288_04090 [Stachybotrys chartarum IBT 40288]
MVPQSILAGSKRKRHFCPRRFTSYHTGRAPCLEAHLGEPHMGGLRPDAAKPPWLVEGHEEGVWLGGEDPAARVLFASSHPQVRLPMEAAATVWNVASEHNPSSSTPSSPSTPPQPPVVRSRIFHSYTLKKLLEEFSIPFTDDRLHVAGNDAHFTLRALLMIAVCDVRRELNEAPVWVWVPVLEAVARAPLPPDATQAWAEGGYEEKREESGCY